VLALAAAAGLALWWLVSREDAPAPVAAPAAPAAVPEPLPVEALRLDERREMPVEPPAVAPREVEPIAPEPARANGAFAGLALDQHDLPVPALEIWLAKAGDPPTRFFQPHEAEAVAARTTTDGSGRFEFRGVAPGPWWIGPGAGTLAEPSKSEAATQASKFEMTGSATVPITLRVHLAIYVRGLVLDPEGKPMPKAWVWAMDEGASGLQAESDGDGRFAIGPAAPGRYTLVAFRNAGHASSDRVEADAGSEDVVLRLRPGGSLRGRVVDSRTGEGCPAELHLAARGPPRGWSGDMTGWTSRDDGTFDADALEPGLYDLCAGTMDGRFGMLRAVGVRAGAETGDLIVSVVPAGRVRLRCEGSRPSVLGRVFADGVPISFERIVKQGEPLSVLAPAGAVEVRFRSPESDSLETRVVEVRAGETQDVVFADPR
jgi:hypothetical protein